MIALVKRVGTTRGIDMALLDNWLQESKENRKLFAEEGLILEVTEAIWASLKLKGWSQKELAEALGVSRSHVSQLLDGRRNMTLRTLADIAFALGLEPKMKLCDPKEAANWENVPAVIGPTLMAVNDDAVVRADDNPWVNIRLKKVA